MEFISALKAVKFEPNENLRSFSQNLYVYYKYLLSKHNLDEILSITKLSKSDKIEIIQAMLVLFRNYLYSKYPHIDKEVIDFFFSIEHSFDEIRCKLEGKEHDYLEMHRPFLEDLNSIMIPELHLYLNPHLGTDLFSSIFVSQISAINNAYLYMTGRTF